MTQRIVSLREIRLDCITNCLTDNSSYFLIRVAQTKITLFIFVNNWVIRENESFLIVEPCSRLSRAVFSSNLLCENKVTIFLS